MSSVCPARFAHSPGTQATFRNTLRRGPPQLQGQHEGTDLVYWQHLLSQFSNAKTLRVSQKLAGHVVLALEDIPEETVTEVVSSLKSIRLVGRRASSVKLADLSPPAVSLIAP